MTPTCNNPWRLRAWRCLVWLGCAVLLFGQGLPNPAAPPPLVCAADADSEAESVPVPDDDDEAEAVPSPSTSRCRRAVRRTVLTVIPADRLAHLPHHHSGLSGFSPPVCSPFQQDGALLPLRC